MLAHLCVTDSSFLLSLETKKKSDVCAKGKSAHECPGSISIGQFFSVCGGGEKKGA